MPLVNPDLNHDGTPEDIERVIALYPVAGPFGQKRRYTDDQLRVMMAERCPHGRPTTTVCGCGSGDMDHMFCPDCI